VNYAAAGYWWEIYPPVVAIVLVVVALNFVGDALRDAFEVRLQRPLIAIDIRTRELGASMQ